MVVVMLDVNRIRDENELMRMEHIIKSFDADASHGTHCE